MKKVLLLLLISLIIYAVFFSEKARLDREVDRLCAIDGGIRVYETVKLPPDKFDKHGQINFYRPTQGEDALGLEYIFKWDRHNYKKRDSEQGPHEVAIRQNHFKIIRKSDMKLLGEFVLYSRVGGDLPGPWAPSSYRCPELEINEYILMHRIFIKSGREIEG
ncbi:hypothetical protein [Nitrosomonas supralitoralis]|uniref:Uncharacterized protein n=1 Tax=Nitrosomonas supralitoralis TaxID=2116706 RepID=A0A2P7NZC9_9PROT|nr:hypothetical protein [Nitrosomonas supralitoralis]PSJ18820.1 hypothetical protein C7H79_00925 [Nitrosomonas supralitoralis]